MLSQGVLYYGKHTPLGSPDDDVGIIVDIPAVIPNVPIDTPCDNSMPIIAGFGAMLESQDGEDCQKPVPVTPTTRVASTDDVSRASASVTMATADWTAQLGFVSETLSNAQDTEIASTAFASVTTVGALLIVRKESRSVPRQQLTFRNVLASSMECVIP